MINLNNNILAIPKGHSTFNLNTVVDFDSKESEMGNKSYMNVDGSYIGKVRISREEYVIFLKKDKDYIYLLNLKDKSLVEVKSGDFNFNIDYPIKGQYRLINGCERVIYFNDYYNPDRYINIDKNPEVRDIINNGFPYESIDLKVSSGGGKLKPGKYLVVIEELDSNENTVYINYASRPVFITNGQGSPSKDYVSEEEGGIPELNKVINVTVKVKNEITKYIKVNYIYYGFEQDTNPLAYRSLKLNTKVGDTFKGVITGYDISNIDFTEMYQYNYPKYSRSLLQVDNELLRLNTYDLKVDYSEFQKYSNNIKVRVAIDTEIYDRENYIPIPTEKRGMVKALSISYIHKDGYEIGPFHIPPVDRIVDYTSSNYVDEASGLGPFDDQLTNDERRLSQLLGADNYTGIYTTKEIYPEVDGYPDYWGDLKGKNVRHHLIPYHIAKTLNNYTEAVKIGLYFTDITYPPDVVGHRLYYYDFEDSIGPMGYIADPSFTTGATVNSTTGSVIGIPLSSSVEEFTDNLVKCRAGLKEAYLFCPDMYMKGSIENYDLAYTNKDHIVTGRLEIKGFEYDDHINKYQSYFSLMQFDVDTNMTPLVHVNKYNTNVKPTFTPIKKISSLQPQDTVITNHTKPLSNFNLLYPNLLHNPYISLSLIYLESYHYLFNSFGYEFDTIADYILNSNKRDPADGWQTAENIIETTLFNKDFYVPSLVDINYYPLHSEGYYNTNPITLYNGDYYISFLEQTGLHKLGYDEKSDGKKAIHNSTVYIRDMPVESKYIYNYLYTGYTSPTMRYKSNINQTYKLGISGGEVSNLYENSLWEYMRKKYTKASKINEYEFTPEVFKEQFNYNNALLNPTGFNRLSNINILNDLKNKCINYQPYRIWISNNSGFFDVQDNYLRFSPTNFTDISTATTPITSANIVGETIVVRTQNSTFVNSVRESQLDLKDQQVVLNPSGLFNLSFVELNRNEIGFVGQQDILFEEETEHGLVWGDKERGKIILYKTGIEEISREYVFDLFKDKTALPIMSYDPKYERLLITYKREFSYTISYSFRLKKWVSFHSYIPNHYFYNSNTLFTLYNNVLWSHNNSKLEFYNNVYPFAVEEVIVTGDKTELYGFKVLMDIRDKTLDLTDTYVEVFNNFTSTGFLKAMEDNNGIDIYFNKEKNILHYNRQENYFLFNTLENLLEDNKNPSQLIKSPLFYSLDQGFIDRISANIDYDKPLHLRSGIQGHYYRVRLFFFDSENKKIIYNIIPIVDSII